MAELAETQCVHWPRSCADAQAQCATGFQFCDFCLYGPPEPPVRRDNEAISLDKALERAESTERELGERLRKAVVAAVAEEGF
jgi:hypothetical protein